MEKPTTPPTLDDIGARLQVARKNVDDLSGKNKSGGRADAKGIGIAVRIGVELICAIGVGFGLGYVLDRWLDTAPLFMVVLLFLGGAAGVMNVYRVVKGLDDTVGLGRAMERKEETVSSEREENE